MCLGVRRTCETAVKLFLVADPCSSVFIGGFIHTFGRYTGVEFGESAFFRFCLKSALQ